MTVKKQPQQKTKTSNASKAILIEAIIAIKMSVIKLENIIYDVDKAIGDNDNAK